MTDSVSKKLGKVIQIDEEQIREHLGNLVRGTVEETLNKLLDACPNRQIMTQRN